MPGGRPTKFKPAYCGAVIDHMTEGASLTSFAASIGVSRATINVWIAEHPEFLEAAHIGKSKCAAWWEERGRNIANGNGGPGASTLAVFGMKNMGRDDWSDIQQFEHSGPGGSPLNISVKFVGDDD